MCLKWPGHELSPSHCVCKLTHYILSVRKVWMCWLHHVWLTRRSTVYVCVCERWAGVYWLLYRTAPPENHVNARYEQDLRAEREEERGGLNKYLLFLAWLCWSEAPGWEHRGWGKNIRLNRFWLVFPLDLRTNSNRVTLVRSFSGISFCYRQRTFWSATVSFSWVKSSGKNSRETECYYLQHMVCDNMCS